jgi:hypothetical protein
VQLSAAIVWSSGSASLRDQISGGHSAEVPPVPIPNTAVKLSSVDGSRTAGSLESRTSPDYSPASPLTPQGGRGFVVVVSVRAADRRALLRGVACEREVDEAGEWWRGR